MIRKENKKLLFVDDYLVKENLKNREKVIDIRLKQICIIYTKYILGARHCPKPFLVINLFTLHKDPMKYLLLFSSL